MSYRVYDEDVMDTPANYSLTLDISSGYDVKNPDGTNPVATLKVNAPTHRMAFVALNSLAEDQATAVLGLILDSIATELQLPNELSYEEVMEQDSFAEAFAENHLPFLTIDLSVDATTPEGETLEINFLLTAPSYKIAYQAFVALTSREKLNGVLASLMPYEDDEDY